MRFPLAASAFRATAWATLALVGAAAIAAGIRVLPWILDPSVPMRVVWPFARGLGALAVEAALLVAWPVGWAFAALAFVERGEALALRALGERPARTVARLSSQALVLGAALAFVSWVGGRDAAAPGRVVDELFAASREACAHVTIARTYVVPLVGVTWTCAPERTPRLVAEAPLRDPKLGGVHLSAADVTVAGDLRRFELRDAWVYLGPAGAAGGAVSAAPASPASPPDPTSPATSSPATSTPATSAPATSGGVGALGVRALRLHAGRLTMRGLPPWTRASGVPSWLRAAALVAAAIASAVVAATTVLTRPSSPAPGGDPPSAPHAPPHATAPPHANAPPNANARANARANANVIARAIAWIRTGRLGALILGAAGPLAALATLRLLERHDAPLRAYALVPLAAAALSLAFAGASRAPGALRKRGRARGRAFTRSRPM